MVWNPLRAKCSSVSRSSGLGSRIQPTLEQLENRLAMTVALDLVNIGNPNNAPDVSPYGTYGAVGYEFRLSTKETTVAQYTEFLNAVAKYIPQDTPTEKYDYLRDLWQKGMENGYVLGQTISRAQDPVSGAYSYTATIGRENFPVAYTTWFAAARFANWMHNGQPLATASSADPGTETGAYTLNGAYENEVILKNPVAKYWIPSEDEWYKAAYYDPTLNANQGGYWEFATRSNQQPYDGSPPNFHQANSANYNAFTSTQKLFNVGSFVNSTSYYGTYDQAGSLWEWNDAVVDNYQGQPNSRGVRGGSWSLGLLNLDKETRRDYTPEEDDDDTGFRLASSEPATVFPAVPPAAVPSSSIPPTPIAAPFSLSGGSQVLSLGDGTVGIRSADGAYQVVTPFPGYNGPLSVATMSRTGGPNADTVLIAVAGRAAPHVLTLDAATGQVLSSFLAFDQSFTGGVTVAGGVTRLNGVNLPVILCGAGSGAEPSVSLFQAAAGTSLGAFYAFDPAYRGGVQVALSDPAAGGIAYAVVASGTNGHVVAFDLNNTEVPHSSFFTQTGGERATESVSIAAGKLGSDGALKIVVGAGAGSAPQVVVYSMNGTLEKQFLAFAEGFQGGVNVSLADQNRDGTLEILAASGPGAQGTLNAFSYQTLALQSAQIVSTGLGGIAAGVNFTRVPVSSGPVSTLLEMTTVGDAFNAADSTGFGRVDYAFNIGKYEVTVAQYTQFLNAVASNPLERQYINDLWQPAMADSTEKVGALVYRDTLEDGTYSYRVAKDPLDQTKDRGNRPVAWTNWFAAARFANWVHNGTPSGTGTETGAYTLDGAMTGVFQRNSDALFWIPSEDEWYKAAYYDPQKSFPNTPGYWKYATQSDTLPDDTRGGFTVANAANYNDTGARNNKLTDVGSYVNSPSHYGTFDQTGNLWEWNDAIFMTPSTGKPDSRGVRGGSWSQGILAVENLTLRDYPDGYRAPDGYLFYSDDDTGFRLAGVMPAPLGVTPPA